MKKLTTVITGIFALTLACSVFSCSEPIEKQSNSGTKTSQSQNGQTQTETDSGAAQTPSESSAPSYEPHVTTEKQRTFIKRMANAVMRFEKEVDVSDLHISCKSLPNKEPEYKTLYRDFFTYLESQNVFLFHLPLYTDPAYTYKPEAEDEVALYKIDYLTEAAGAESDFQKLTAAFLRYYAAVQESMSEAEAAYALYRELDKNVVYGENTGSQYQRTPIGALLDGKGVCEDYSRSYQQLLRGLRIASVCLEGKERAVYEGPTISHMWNSIQIEGQWYNVDATWDDYEWAERKGCSSCLGKHFLTSNNQFYGTLNHPLVYERYKPRPPNAVDTRYESGTCVFRNGDKKSEPFYHKGYWYYFSYNDKSICRSHFDGTDSQTLYQKKYAADMQYSSPSYAKLHRLAFGAEKIYFVDWEQAYSSPLTLYSLTYNGTDLQKLGNAPSPSVPLKDDSDIPLTEKPGLKALKVEIMLCKMKDAYYHGAEDYFTPESQERKDFIFAIRTAEALTAFPALNTAEAERLYNRLRLLRGGAGMEKTRSK